MICPDQQSTFEQLLALLPRGRAWQNYDAGAVVADDSTMQRFFRAVAVGINYAETAICDAFLEFSCATAIYDLDLWLEDYGLPDECDPTGDDLCAKVAATGGESPAYWEAVAASLGIVASFRYLKGDPDEPDYPGVTATLVARIDVDASFSEEQRPPFWGAFNWGVQRLGDPQPGNIACVLEKSLPAHLAFIMEFV